ncbi:MAG: 16S rRNA (uracil(1498)-N(3))-methyltransferase [Chitinophagaceae bacterium]|jgi:16S rRNA (uracil1498-N3)-methyltransferase|nr:16S rRNA (uracil(1498)-N(3))-methyltransferase [Chitinophagaceae bacterium]
MLHAGTTFAPMGASVFFIADAEVGQVLALDDASARHALQVLRMQPGEQLQLTNGEGMLWQATIANAGKKQCTVHIEAVQKMPLPTRQRVILAIAPVKNGSRLEWFIEKATELGVAEIILLQTHRTEKQHIRFERLMNICISALLQSGHCWLPRLVPPQPLEKVLAQSDAAHKYIAHCNNPAARAPLARLAPCITGSSLLLIGPEGDFTSDEVNLALQQGFAEVSLGQTRLRTETAGIAGAVMLCSA